MNSWSLRVRIGAAEYLLSPDDISPLDAQGARLAHLPLLEPLVVEESLKWREGAGGTSGASVAFYLPDGALSDYADENQPVLCIQAELAKISDTDPWLSRLVVAKGILSIERLAIDGELVEGNIEAVAAEGSFPSDSVSVSAATWGTDNYLEQSEGTFYPKVFGAPGRYVANDGTIISTKGHATKMLGVQVDGAGKAEVGIISDQWVEAGTVKLYSVPDAAYIASQPVLLGDDLLGQPYSYIDLTDGAIVSPPASWERTDDMEIYVVSWNDGGISDPATGELLKGAASVARWLLEGGGADIDAGSFWEAAAYCDRVWLAGYIDEQIEPEGYIAENIQSLCPRLYLIPGPAGLRAVALQDPYPSAPLLIMEQTCQPGADAEITIADGGLTSYRLNFAPSIEAGKYKAYVTVADKLPADPDNYTDLANAFAAAARSRLPAAVDEVEDTDIVYDRSTATIVCEEQLFWGWTAAQFFPAVIHVDEDDARYRLGAYIRLTDDRRGFNEQGCWVVGRREEGDAMTLTVGMLR